MRETNSGALIDVEGATYRYRRGAAALADVTLSVERGTLAGIVGPNGSGKTTLYRLLLGFLQPDAGSLTIDGLAPALYRRRHGIGYLPESVGLPADVRVGELVRTVLQLGTRDARSGEEYRRGLVRALGLEARLRDPIGALSHGFRQRTGLLASLIGDPQLVLLDEPANGLDPDSLGVLRSLLRDLRRRGKTVLLSSHNLLELERVCDAVVIMREGRVVGRVTREQLQRCPDVWVVQVVGNGAVPPDPGDDSLRRYAVRLAADEVAFTSESAARAWAREVVRGGTRVESIERKPFDLEYLFHRLVQRSREEE